MILDSDAQKYGGHGRLDSQQGPLPDRRPATLNVPQTKQSLLGVNRLTEESCRYFVEL